MIFPMGNHSMLSYYGRHCLCKMLDMEVGKLLQDSTLHKLCDDESFVVRKFEHLILLSPESTNKFR